MDMIKKKWIKIFAGVLFTVFLMYLMIYIDVVLRARSAYLEGEKYWQWYENPSKKQLDLQKEFEAEKQKLDKQLLKNKITKQDYDRELEIIKFNYEQKLQESSIKYAYIWYQTAVELFSPPESKWVRLSRKKMPIAKEKWKEELRKKGIQFEDYMLD